jgi:hypothetical protein
MSDRAPVDLEEQDDYLSQEIVDVLRWRIICYMALLRTHKEGSKEYKAMFDPNLFKEGLWKQTHAVAAMLAGFVAGIQAHDLDNLKEWLDHDEKWQFYVKTYGLEYCTTFCKNQFDVNVAKHFLRGSTFGKQKSLLRALTATDKAGGKLVVCTVRRPGYDFVGHAPINVVRLDDGGVRRS